MTMRVIASGAGRRQDSRMCVNPIIQGSVRGMSGTRAILLSPTIGIRA